MSKKICFIFAAFLIMYCSAMAFAEPIVELAAPRMTTPKIIGDDGLAAKSAVKPSSQKASQAKVKKSPYKGVTKQVSKAKLKPAVLDYGKISKMIEYGYYDNADKILQSAIARNPKDIKAQALFVISLAKQSKLAPAQKELGLLLKKYPNNSDLHYAQGVVYYQRTSSSNMVYRNNTQKLMADALSEFKKSILLDKNNAKAYNAAGVISLNLGSQSEASDYFKKALVTDKTYSLAIDNLGTIDFINGKYSDAEKKFEQALSFNSQNTTAMYHLAQIGMQKKDYAYSLYYLNNALALNSNSPAIYNLMGKAYFSQGNDAAAINSFKKSILVKPEFTPSYLDLAEIYERRGDYELAMTQLKTALTLDSDFNEARLRLADLSFYTGDYNQSVEVYSELVGVKDYNSAALKGLANAYYGLAQISSDKASLGTNKKLFNALDSINKAIAANNNDLELHLAKLRLTKITNQPVPSAIILEKTIKAPTSGLVGMLTKGEAYLTLGDYSNAQKTFDSVINLSKNMQEDMDLAEIFIYHKQYDSAQKILEKILKNDVQNQEALCHLDFIQKSKKSASNCYKTALSFLKSKNQNAAIDYLSRSLEINPNNAQAHLLLAQLSEKQKDFSEALINYKAYLGLEPYAANAKAIAKKIKNLEDRL